ncbi:MAG: cell division protein FtsA [Patescibacteria group bacterium]
MSQPLLVGVDLGSSRIRFAMGQVTDIPDRGLSLSIVGAVDVPSHGISKGVVTELEDAVAAVSAAHEQAERQIGMPIEEAIVGIGGTHFTVADAKGVVGVSRADREIRPDDVERAMQDAKGSVNPANYEILHVLPHSFIVDGQAGIQDPVGMHGIRIEARAHLVLGLAGNVRNMTKCVFRTGMDISSLAFGAIPASIAVTSGRERELGVCIINIGAATTSVVVYENGELLHAIVLPIGGDHVTSDIAIGLRTSLDVAERIKIAHGNAVPDTYTKRDEVRLSDFGAQEDDVVTLRYVSEIIQARTEEIFEKVEAELRTIDRSGMLPAGAVLIGGGAKLAGSIVAAKNALRLPATVGSANHIHTTMQEYTDDPAFSTAVGLVQWGFDEMRKNIDSGNRRYGRTGAKMLGKIGASIGKIFKSFVP